MSSTEKRAQAFSPDDALPSPDQISAANEAHVLDNQGNRVSFSSLLEKSQSNKVPLLLVFTRHFHCGMCKQFNQALAHSSIITDQSRVSVVVVGPGQAAGLDQYKSQVNNPPFQFYADPDLKLYNALGVTRKNLDLGDSNEIGSHHKGSFSQNLLSSVAAMVKSPTLALKGGDIKQLGGEFVWNAQGEPVLAHRMRHTRDHSEVSTLEKAVTSN
uniref:Related to glucose 1-dehydrogenase n=1 Tax=Melanopsichium pennsylvanicum 4 TaxID=1398559 RepID=A0A077R164_9BASI|nr:related to glucose 1-dehydrogenase [Melanopsichium pennsylvanicum 4]